VEIVSADELHLERLIAASPDELFRLWTTPELLVTWWGPEGVDIPEHALDIRPGGAWRTTMRQPNGTRHTVSGTYLEIDPPRRLAFTWAWEDIAGQRGHETVVDVRFETAPGGTRLVLRQARFLDEESRNRHQNGWSSSFDCLARATAKREG
jgi:uncharacterized protein YndB with AHSA1/START domain